MTRWQIVNEEILYDWISAQTDREVVETILEWLPELAADPWVNALPVPTHHLVVLRLSPVPGIVFRYLIAEQFHAIRLIAIDDLNVFGGE